MPVTRITGWHLATADSGGKEAIGTRIVEVPEVLEQFVSRDARARFIAYAPPGSIDKGQALASGKGGLLQCAVCHGYDLKGQGLVPGIAGRSPVYVVRQLYDFKHGARKGTGSLQMKPVVEKLKIADMVALAAYLGSLAP